MRKNLHYIALLQCVPSFSLQANNEMHYNSLLLPLRTADYVLEGMLRSQVSTGQRVLLLHNPLSFPRNTWFLPNAHINLCFDILILPTLANAATVAEFLVVYMFTLSIGAFLSSYHQVSNICGSINSLYDKSLRSYSGFGGG